MATSETYTTGGHVACEWSVALYCPVQAQSDNYAGNGLMKPDRRRKCLGKMKLSHGRNVF